MRQAPRGADNEDLHTGLLKQVNPLDVAVLPVQNSTGIEGLPLERMRRAFHSGLVRARYSPLALAHVDEKIVEASYVPGELEEQAVFQFFLTGWDDRRWESSAELIVTGDVYMLDVAHPDPSQALWGGKVSRRVSVLELRPTCSTDSELRDRAVDRFVEDVLASLPARNPEREATK